MDNHTGLRFLQDKIEDLQSALLFSEHNALLRLSTSVVHVSKMDDLGQLWFFMSKPPQDLHEFDKEFPVRMEFFKKGRRYFLHLKGKAFIIDDPEEVNHVIFSDILPEVPANMILIKVKMVQAEYFESLAARHAGWWSDLRTRLYAWLFNSRPGYKPYHFYGADTSLA